MSPHLSLLLHNADYKQLGIQLPRLNPVIQAIDRHLF